MTEAALPTSAPESTSIARRLLSDERLARRAAQGDAQAFEAIYLRYHQKLFRFCLAMTANPQDAQDALQNTMVKVLRALPGEERQIKLKPWLFRIARNEAIEVQRKRHKNEELDVERLTEGAVSDTAEVRERLRTLLADLDQLPERQRAVLLMRELSGLEFSEIGAAYETSEGAVRQALYEARLNLRALEEGRERACAEVRRELSDADGRVIRRRRTRARSAQLSRLPRLRRRNRRAPAEPRRGRAASARGLGGHAARRAGSVRRAGRGSGGRQRSRHRGHSRHRDRTDAGDVSRDQIGGSRRRGGTQRRGRRRGRPARPSRARRRRWGRAISVKPERRRDPRPRADCGPGRCPRRR